MVIERAEKLFGQNPIRYVDGLWRLAVLHAEDRRFRVLIRTGIDAKRLREALTVVCDDFEAERWDRPSAVTAWRSSAGWRPAGAWLPIDAAGDAAVDAAVE